MLITESLTKEYHGKPVVKDLSLRVEPGEIFGFLGPNGAGKSTTINMILGLIPPTRGAIRLFGKRLAEDPSGIKSRVGVVAEIQHLYGEMTGYEYLAFFADLYRVADKKQRITRLLEQVNLASFQNLQLKAYSKGMQQKLALARALVHDPDLLIMDEPVSSLDPQGIKQVRDIILEENRRGKTFLISSHLLSEIEKTCHRIGIIHHGLLLAEDTMDGVKEKLTEGAQLEIELENPSPGIEKQLQTLAFVRFVTVDGKLLTVGTSGGQDYRGEIAKFFISHGCVVISMTRDQMSLEEAFVTITEKNLSLLTTRGVAS